jgi:Phage integrase, N-terminal SAM-like domain
MREVGESRRSDGGKAVGGAQDAGRAAVEDVGVDHGGGDVAVAEKFLDGSDVGAVFQQVGGEGVAEGVAGGALGDALTAYRLLHRALQHGFVQVVATPLAGLAVEIRAGSREDPYVGWIRRPAEMGAAEITRFLSALAIERNVAASNQNQALSALLFLYKEVLEQQLPWTDDIVRAKTPVRIPVVLTREEVRTVIAGLDGPTRLLALCSTARASDCWRRRSSA